MATKKKSDEPAQPATKSKKASTKAAAAKAPAKAPAKKPAKTDKKHEKKPEKVPAPKVASGPLARVKAVYGSKETLIKGLVEPLANGEDGEALRSRLFKASNQKLLRLARVVEQVKQKYGGRQQLVEALGKVAGKAKDKDYLNKLGSFSLPKLWDLVTAAERRAKRAA